MSDFEHFENNLSKFLDDERHLEKVDLFRGEWVYPPLDELFYNYYVQRKDMSLNGALKRNITKVLWKHVDFNIVHGGNIIAFIAGKQLAGKSIIAQAFGDEIRKRFKKLLKKMVELRFSFTTSQSMQTLPESNNGDIINQDEDPDLLGTGSANAKKRINNLIRAVRQTQKSILICNPDYKGYPGLSLVLIPFGWKADFLETGNTNDMKTRVIVLYKSDIFHVSEEHSMLGYAVIDLGEVYESIYLKEYKPLKDQYIAELEANQGAVGVEKDVEREKQLAAELRVIALQAGWQGNSKKALLTYIRDLQFEYRKKHGRSLPLEQSDEESIVQRAYDMQRDAVSAKPSPQANLNPSQIDFGDDFEVSLDDILEEIKADPHPKWVKKERDLHIYHLRVKEGRGNDEITQFYPFNDQSNVTKIVKKIDGMISEKIGRYFEQYRTQKLEDSGEWDEVHNDGGKGEPDVWAVKGKHLYVESDKCFNFSRPTYSIPIKEVQAEIAFAIASEKEFDTVEVVAHIKNRYDGQEYTFPINYKRPPKTIRIRRSP